jgi:hypothetical protein
MTKEVILSSEFLLLLQTKNVAIWHKKVSISSRYLFLCVILNEENEIEKEKRRYRT